MTKIRLRVYFIFILFFFSINIFANAMLGKSLKNFEQYDKDKLQLNLTLKINIKKEKQYTTKTNSDSSTNSENKTTNSIFPQSLPIPIPKRTAYQEAKNKKNDAILLKQKQENYSDDFIIDDNKELFLDYSNENNNKIKNYYGFYISKNPLGYETQNYKIKLAEPGKILDFEKITIKNNEHFVYNCKILQNLFDTVCKEKKIKSIPFNSYFEFNDNKDSSIGFIFVENITINIFKKTALPIEFQLIKANDPLKQTSFDQLDQMVKMFVLILKEKYNPKQEIQFYLNESELENLELKLLNVDYLKKFLNKNDDNVMEFKKKFFKQTNDFSITTKINFTNILYLSTLIKNNFSFLETEIDEDLDIIIDLNNEEINFYDSFSTLKNITLLFEYKFTEEQENKKSINIDFNLQQKQQINDELKKINKSYFENQKIINIAPILKLLKRNHYI